MKLFLALIDLIKVNMLQNNQPTYTSYDDIDRIFPCQYYHLSITGIMVFYFWFTMVVSIFLYAYLYYALLQMLPAQVCDLLYLKF